jgi:phospholipid:diacylglycerol acyltransferase
MRKRKGTSTQKLAWLFFSLHPLSRNSLPNPRQDPGWTERHVAAYANIAGPTLGAAKSLPALLSGETRDTAELGAVAAFLGENYVPRGLRASLFRTWPGAYGMLPLGGSRVWGRPLAQAGRGDENKSSASFSGGAPDDTPAMRRRGVSHGALLTVDGQQMDVARALRVLSDSLPAHAAAHVAEALAAAASGGGGGAAGGGGGAGDGGGGAAGGGGGAAGGDGGAAAPETPCHGGAVDPLRCPLPLAPSMRLYCIYGTGKPTERAYSYVKTPSTAEPATAASEGREAARGSSTAASAATAAAQAAEELRIDTDASEDARDVAESAVDDEDEEEEGKGGGEGGGGRGGREEDAAPSPPASAPARSSRSLGSLENGVRVSDGDGTVPLISLGTLCARHWRADPRDPKRKGSRLNPSNLSVVTREARHSPRDFLLGGTLDPRGGDGSADHVDILMNAGVLEDVIAIVSGRGGELSDKIFSRIREIAARVEI